VGDHKVRGKAERFADHYTQATLFWNSQTKVEQAHIINAFRFELSKVQTPAIRERMVSGLMNVAPELAAAVAKGLGITELPAPMPKVLKKDVKPEVTKSPSLSLFARPGHGGIRARTVGILIADGVQGAALTGLAERLAAGGAVARFIGPTLGAVATEEGTSIAVDIPISATAAVLYDAMVLPDGTDAVDRLSADGRMLEFVKDQYRHCKPILVLGAASQILGRAGVPSTLPSGGPDPGLVMGSGQKSTPADAFIELLAKHRQFDRETDPPRV
jgi:catalase